MFVRSTSRRASWAVALAAGIGWLVGAISPIDTRADDSNDHWAYQRLKPPTWSTQADPGHAIVTVDVFVTQKLATAGLKLNRAADPATLLRRLSLDLTG